MVQAPSENGAQPVTWCRSNPTWSGMAHNNGVPGRIIERDLSIVQVNETMLPPPALALFLTPAAYEFGRLEALKRLDWLADSKLHAGVS